MATNYLVTGTSRGIGLELVRQLLESGKNVYALARKPDQAPELQRLRGRFPQNLFVYAVDVTSDRDVQAFSKELGSGTAIDVLINNAGISSSYKNEIETLSLDEIQKVFQTNTLAPIRMLQAVFKNLKQSKSSPKVVNITSLMGSIGDNESGQSYAYRMSKTALNMFTKCLSIDHPEIISLVVHPGWVQTDMGGSEAPTPVQESARGILKVIEQSGSKDSGRFLDFEGDELPW